MPKTNRRINPTAEAPLLEHLEELRSRILWAMGFWLAGTAVAWNFKDDLIRFMQVPLDSVRDRVQIVTTGLTDQLFIAFSVALWGGFVLALPFMLYQLWRFIEPGLTASEQRWSVPFILGAGLSFGLGCLFCFEVVLPAAIPFLVTFLGESTGIKALLNIAGYISNVLTYLVVFGIIFELPIISFLLTKIGLINATLLRSVRRYAIVLLVVAAAIITPTADPFNLMLMAVPMYVLYELGVLVSDWAAPRKTRVHERGEIEI